MSLSFVFSFFFFFFFFFCSFFGADFVSGQNLNRALRCNRSLLGLSLDFNRLTDLGLLSIIEGLLPPNNRTLTALSVQYNRTSSDSLSLFAQVIRSHPKLRSLSLRHETRSTAAICEALTHNRTITELYVWLLCLCVLHVLFSCDVM